jgi:hypothetical protein
MDERGIPEAAQGVTAVQVALLIRERTRLEASVVALRLGVAVARRFGLEAVCAPATADAPAGPRAGAAADTLAETLANSLAFVVREAAARKVTAASLPAWETERRNWREPGDLHPLSRLAAVAAAPAWSALIVDLVLLAGLPELHEGYAALFRQLHPDGEPYPTVALALHWLESEQPHAAATVRDAVEELLLHSRLAAVGLLRLEGAGPWHGRRLRPGPGVWQALQARPPLPDDGVLLAGVRQVPGLDSWLEQSEVRRAARALARGEPCLVALTGGTAAMRATRARALLGAAGVGAIHTALALSAPQAEREAAATAAYCCAFMHRAVPWLDIDGGDDGADAGWGRAPLRRLQWDVPVLATAPYDRALPDLRLPLLALPVQPLPATARRALWAALLPGLAAQAGALAASYPVEPGEALDVASDLALRSQVDGRALTPADVGACVRARTAWHARPGVTRVTPRAGWDGLLLPPAAERQLHEAVLRVRQQMTVLDDWGFEQGRHERRGLRMLFYGPPGTGKTLAAEAVAHALGVDMLVADIASLVSKWIGETEKNLAAVFDLAERARALLVFDEADALFGQRTETSDAHDRYANLETAFLLQRLERYQGAAILTTNLRNSLDAAFTRRFEFIVEFPEPDEAARSALWRLHLPAGAPLAADVDLDQLAQWYALSGAQIRNAALAAAFLGAAAGEGEAAARACIRRQDFLLAIEREYDKAGKAHPGHPPRRGNAPTHPLFNV